MYADDTTLLLPFDKNEELITKLENNLAVSTDRLEEINLNINKQNLQLFSLQTKTQQQHHIARRLVPV